MGGFTHVYLAHPYGGIEDNLVEATRSYAALSAAFPEHLFIADWIHHCIGFSDASPELRELGMQRNFSQIERADELWAVGFDGITISPGMEEEIFFAMTEGKTVRHAKIVISEGFPVIHLSPPLEKTDAQNQAEEAN